MSYGWLMGMVTASTLTHYYLVARQQGRLSVDSLFVIFQWVMAVGTLAILDPNDPRDDLYAYVVTIPVFIYTAASIAICYVFRRQAPGHRVPDTPLLVVPMKPPTGIILLLILAIFVTAAYYYSVGYNVFVRAIQDQLSGSTSNYTDLRLESYGGSRYLFPGYVNQFKNTILPSLSLVVVHYLFTERRPHRVPLSAALVGVSLIGILGTGQRGAFIQFVLAVIVFLYLIDRRKFKRRAFVAFLWMTPLLVFSTALLGRGKPLGPASDTFLARISDYIGQLFDRFFYVNQWSGQMSFWVTSQRPTQKGNEWATSLLGILPGGTNAQLSLSQEVFFVLFGSARGTAPPSLWGSVHYNFGWAGLILVPLVLAAVYQNVSRRVARRSELNSLEAISIAGVAVIFGNWIQGGPDYILNAGGLTFVILWWIGRRYARTSLVRKVPATTPDLAPNHTVK